MKDFLVLFLQLFLGLLEWVIILQVLYSWFRPHSNSFLHRTLLSITRPMYRFVGKIIPPLGVLDLSPLICLLIIQFGGSALINFLMNL